LLYSREYDLDPYLVFSVIKVESNFSLCAKSNKGALGLMQILPATAEYIADKLNIEDYDLFDSKINIKFGCYYLRYLLDKFNCADLVLCAYNAGEGNVNKWLNDKRYSNDKVSLVYIPFYETREYVKLVNKNFKIYKKIYADFVDKS
jgi:soluble lytic murein transglycosylase